MNNRKIIGNGVVIDNRDLEASKETLINDYRQQTNYNIIVVEGLDEVTQINAALGIYDETRTEEIRTKIEFWRNKFITAKNQILAATTLEELDSVEL